MARDRGIAFQAAFGVANAHLLFTREAYPSSAYELLAGLAQGPGFPNLSCLGLLSDRILRRYVPSGRPDRIDQERGARDRSAR